MRNLKNNEYQLFCSLAKVSQNSLRKTLKSYLKNKYDMVFVSEDYLYAVGDIPIALCAHMDTVFNKPPEDIYYDREKGVMWSPNGLGADDRAGIYSIIKILNDGYKPSVLFCADEEKGALGAELLVQDCKFPIAPINFIIELDRRGTNDCVFYDCCNEDFISYIEEAGFVESWGSFSDITEICPAWGVAGVNLSIGYEHEHTTSEILRVGPMLDTIKKVEKILDRGEWPEFKYIHKPYNYYNMLYSYPMEYDDEWNYGYGHDFHSCSHCGMPLHAYELIPATGKDGSVQYYCPDCCGEFVEWCYGCGEAFEKGILDKKGFCPICKKKYEGEK